MNTVQVSTLFSLLILISCFSLSRMLSIILNKAIPRTTKTITTKSFQSTSSSSSMASGAFVVALSPWISRRIQNKMINNNYAPEMSQFVPKTTKNFVTTVLTHRKRQLLSKATLSSLISSIDSTSQKGNDNFDILLRYATINDLQLLEYWDTKPHVIECTGEDDYNGNDVDDDWNWETELQRTVEWREQLIAEIVMTTNNNTTTSTRPIGIVQIIDPQLEETHYWGNDFNESNVRAIDIWIGEENDLGKGYGTIIMKQIIQRCFSNDKVVGILIDPLVRNKRACKFYESLGFQFQYYKTFGSDECCIYRLNRIEI